jgi:hypothetical protein
MSNCTEPERNPDPLNPIHGSTSGNPGFGCGDSLFSRAANYRSDLALVRRAVRENGPMKPEDRVRLWAKVTDIRAKHDGRIAKAADAALAEFQKTDSKSRR